MNIVPIGRICSSELQQAVRRAAPSPRSIVRHAICVVHEEIRSIIVKPVSYDIRERLFLLTTYQILQSISQGTTKKI